MTVVAAIDFSPVTEAVLAELPSLVHADEQVILLHVSDPDPAFVGFDTGPEGVRRQVEEKRSAGAQQLEQAAKVLLDKGMNVRSIHTEGPTTEEIFEVVTGAGARLIVIGSHGHSAMYDLFVGSIAKAVIRRADCPVVLVPGKKGT